jgi:hypothetical protein
VADDRVAAVSALVARRSWPVAVLLTLPALAFVGSVIATLVALYSIAVRSGSRYLLAGSGALTAVGYVRRATYSRRERERQQRNRERAEEAESGGDD